MAKYLVFLSIESFVKLAEFVLWIGLQTPGIIDTGALRHIFGHHKIGGKEWNILRMKDPRFPNSHTFNLISLLLWSHSFSTGHNHILLIKACYQALGQVSKCVR